MYLEKAISFLKKINLIVIRAELKHYSLISDIWINQGMLFITDHKNLTESEDLKLTCDLLHEAGHLAVFPSCIRPYISGDVDNARDNPLIEKLFDKAIKENNLTLMHRLVNAGEQETIAWQFAAATAIDIPFFDRLGTGGTFGGKDERYDMIVNLNKGNHYGVHGLQAASMCFRKEYPEMIRWMQI